MTTKLNQKLLEDLRLQKRILLIAENQNQDGCINPKQLDGSYGFPSSADISQPYHNKRPINPRANREDHGVHEYAIFDDEYHDKRHSVSTVSALKKSQRRSHVAEESWKQYDEIPTSFKAFRDLPFYYHYNNFTDSNSILNKRESFKGIGSTKNSAHEYGIAGMPITSTSRESGGGGGDVNNSRIQQLEFDYYNNRRIKRVSQRHQARRSSVDLGEFNLQQQYFSDSDHNVMQDQAYLQLREISRDAQKLGDILKLSSNLSSDGLIKSDKASDVGRDLLKGAMDLEESLRMLAKLQNAARNIRIVDVQGRRSAEHLPREFMALPNNSNAKVLQLEETRNSYRGLSHPENYHLKGSKTPDGSKESTIRTTSSSIDLREAIKSSLSKQKLLYSKRNSSAAKNFDDDDDRNAVKNSGSKPANSNANQQDGKRRIPNVIARLMGLEELPVETRPKITNAGNSRDSKVPSLQAQDLHLAHPLPVNPDVMNSSVESKSTDRGSTRGSRPDPQLHASNLRRRQDSERRPTVTDRKSIEAAPDQFDDTLKTASDRVKHHVPKPSVEFELLEKNRMSKHVGVDQDSKTLKEILESMQIKEILHPRSSSDGPLHESNINSNVVVSKSRSDRDNFRARQKPARTKIQQEQQQYVRGGNMPEIISTDHGTKRNSNDNKIGREATAIVIMKPVPAKLQSPKIKQTQLHDHETESASGKSKQIQGISTVKIISTSSSPSKRILGKGALGIKPDDGQSKKNNSNSGSHRGSRHAGTVIDHGGGHQKQSKPPAAPRPSSPPPPTPVLQELKRRRNERISRTDKKPVDISSSPSTNQEKKELVQTNPSNHIKKNVSLATKSIPVFVSGSTDNSPLDMQHKSDEKLPKEVESAQSRDALTIKRDEEEEEEDQESSISTSSGSHQAKPVISNVAYLECASEEGDTTHCELQAAVQHSPIADHSSPSISPISALELPAEVAQEDRSADGESSTHIHLNDSGHVKRDISSQSIPKPSYEELSDTITEEGYDDVNAKGAEFGEEYSLEWQADYVRQILMNNPTLANSGGGKSSELYPQLYHNLEAQEAAMYSDNIKRGVRHGDHDSIAQRLVFDCVKELLKRKSRRRVPVNQPGFTGMRISLGMKRKNIEELVKELTEDIGELAAYHEVPSCDKYATRDAKFGSDSLYTMVKKDLHLRHDVNSIWGSSWDHGMFGEGEGQEIVRDIEKVILEELLEDVILDQVILS